MIYCFSFFSFETKVSREEEGDVFVVPQVGFVTRTRAYCDIGFQGITRIMTEVTHVVNISQRLWEAAAARYVFAVDVNQKIGQTAGGHSMSREAPIVPWRAAVARWVSGFVAECLLCARQWLFIVNQLWHRPTSLPQLGIVEKSRPIWRIACVFCIFQRWLDPSQNFVLCVKMFTRVIEIFRKEMKG